MIRQFKINDLKDSFGYYIIPSSIENKGHVLTGLKYHENKMKDVKNLMLAVICVTDQGRERDSTVNGWTENYVRINNVLLNFDTFYLDEENDIIYEMDNNDELKIIQRHLKLKKLSKHGI